MYIILSLIYLFSSTSGLETNVRLNRAYKIIIFGDSLTDTGNVYRLTNYTWPITPPYYQGRFSNGPNWVDRLNVTDKSNYAYGGATTDSNFVQGLTKLNTVRVPGIRQQIGFYLNDTSNITVDFNRTLYVIWSGGNDLVFNSSVSIQSIVNSLMNGVRDLLAYGAKNFLIFNQAPIQSFPYFIQRNQTAVATVLTVQANTALLTSLDAIQKNYTYASIQMFDLNTLMTKIIANLTIPFSNTVNRCWDALNLTTVSILCQDPSTYVFIDSLHLTTTVHQLIANAVSPFLSYNGCSKNTASLSILLLSLLILIF